MALTRDRIVSEALDLLQEGGLDGVTLRRLAVRLGVSAPTLYWHLRDKRQLLDLMAEQIVGRSDEMAELPADGQQWDTWLRDRARGLRAALLGYRDSARVLAGNRPTSASLPGFEAQLRVLVDGGFQPEQAMLALMAIGQYVTGHVLDEQLAKGRTPGDADPVAAEIRQGAYPLMLEAFSGGRFDPETRFEEGLTTILAGLRAQLDVQAGCPITDTGGASTPRVATGRGSADPGGR